VRRVANAPLALHALAGALVLVVASAYVGFGGYFFIDEAALYGQLDVLEDGGWTVPRPFPERDVDLEHLPMANSDVAGDRFAPFAKHPVHVLLARGADVVGGDVGVRLLSSAALLMAGLGAALLARADPPTRNLAFWVTLGATPLLFDANLVVAHTLGAAVVAWLGVVIVRMRPGPRRWALTVAPALLGGLLRNEVVLLVGAAAVVLGVVGLRRHSRRELIDAAGLLIGGLGAFLLEPLLVRWSIGGEPGLDRAPTAGSTIGDVLAAAGRSLLEVDATGGTPTGAFGLVACTALVAVAALQLRREVPDRGLLVLSGVGAAAGALLFLREPHLVTGIVWAFPALMLLAGGAPDRISSSTDRTLLVVCALFALLVASTQYSQGGGLEWGWRYVAVAIPLVTPVLARSVIEAWRRHPGLPALGVAGLAVGCVAVQLGGLRVQRTLVHDTEHFLDRVDTVAAEADADFVLAVDASFGRFAYRLSTTGPVATAADGSAERVLRWLADDRVDEVLLVWRFDERNPVTDLGPYAPTGEQWYLASEYRAELLSLG